VKPLDVQTIGNEVAIKWEDGTESYIPIERLRRACPCAACKGEVDIMGNLYKGPEQKLVPQAFLLRSLTPVGTYGLQPVWGDGHNSGIFSFEYLKKVAEAR
jgi:DUF971 family protein